MQWLCAWKPADTTSEPLTGNGQTGAPVKASMSGFLTKATRVEPWNTICIPPLNFRGWGIFFIPSPKPPLEGRCPAGAEGWKSSGQQCAEQNCSPLSQLR